jgi:hypothetical protein
VAAFGSSSREVVPVSLGALPTVAFSTWYQKTILSPELRIEPGVWIAGEKGRRRSLASGQPSAPCARALTHIKKLDDCFGQFLVRVICDCSAYRARRASPKRAVGPQSACRAATLAR